jgi:capsular polysaccharide transport system permease protein
MTGAERISPDMALDRLRETLAGASAADFSVNELFVASEIFYRHKSYREAAEVMEYVAAATPGNAANLYRLGLCLRLSGQSQKAVAALMAALVSMEAGPEAYVELRELLAAEGNFQAAADIVRKHMARLGSSEELLLSLATLLLRSGQREEAAETVRRLAGSPRASYETMMFAVQFFNESRDLAAATEMARQLAARYPGHDSAMTLARQLCQTTQFGEAAQILEDLVHRSAADAEAWSMLSTALSESGRPADGLRAVLKGLEMQPANADFWYRAAILSHRLGLSERALEWLEKARELNPTAAIAVAEANILAEMGRLAEAITTLDRAEKALGRNRDVQSCRLLLMSRAVAEVAAAPSSSLVERLPKSRPPGQAGGGLLNAGLTQGRVIIALMIRDLRSRTVHSHLGLLSALIEPIMQIVMLGVVLTIFNRGLPPLGTSLFFFYATGVMPFYVFLHIVNCTLNVYTDNRELLAVPRIQRLDLAVASALTEVSIGSVTTVIIFALFFLAGYGEGTGNIGAAVAAYAGVCLFAFGVGLIGSVINSYSKIWEHSWQTVQRVLYFLSGIFFIPQMMPDWARAILVWNPLLVGIEWFRSGFFQQYAPPWISPGYLVFVSLACILAGMMLERALKRHAVAVA